MRERAGLPIAAYLGVLVALALASAFVATLAIVIFLPPRPPDVMRADKVAEHFQDGYDYMLGLGRTMNERGMVWEVRAEPPEKSDSPYMRLTQHELAEALELRHDQVRVAADHVTTDDAIVFRVRDIAAIAGDLEFAAADADRISEELERAHEEAQARVEAANERMREATEGYARAHQEAALEAERARLEAWAERQREMAERQAQIAERQAAAAERLAERIEQRIEERIRFEQGRIIIAGEGGSEIEVNPDVDFDIELDPEIDVEEALQAAGLDVAAVPPTPPVAVVPAPAPTPPTAPARTREATRAAPAPRAAPAAPMPPMFAPAPAGVVLISGFEIGAQMPDGRWLVMRQGRNWAELGWIARAAGVIGGTLLVLTILALLFARRLTRPIRNFSEAVQAVGVNPQSEPVREEGPQELRGAARAVNTMQARLRALIADRTKTLAAVAHDMRTPLMRLRLAAENAPPEQRERMAKEIGEVEALVASFIAFARDDPAEEARVRLDLASLLQSIADDHAAQGRNVTFEGEERFVITGQSLGLKRLFANLTENALKYGTNARIKLRDEEGAAIVEVEDDGPGVPPDQRESVFEPFVRLNEEGTRGAGLGLAAARSIARAHGGEIAILDAENGALVRVTLPG